MDKRTESEVKVSKIIEKAMCPNVIKHEGLAAHIESIKLFPYTLSDSLPKVLIITMPKELLLHLKLSYSNAMAALRKEFPSFTILTMRNDKIMPKTASNPLRSREEILADILFPAAIAGRSTEVESKTEMTQIVYLDAKTCCWSKPEIKAINQVLSILFEEDFKINSGFGACY
jgi:hypothetical protein